MSGLPAPPLPPPKGALAGVKQDVQRAKQLGHDTGGIGNAYSHNFLNQKPWHPLNFRNQMKKWEAETKYIQEQKAKEAAQAEFQAEQEKMETYSLCSAEEQKRYRDRQSISFMYAKPPGLEAALAKQAAEEADKANKAKDASAVATTQQGASSSSAPDKQGKGGKPQLSQEQHEEIANRTRDLDRVREDPFALLLSARAALQNNERFAMKTSGGTFGGFSSNAQNQQLLDDDDQGAAPSTSTAQAGPAPLSLQGGYVALPDPASIANMSEKERSALIKRLKKVQKQQEQERKVREAEAILRSAGFDLDALPPVDEGAKEESSKKKRKKHSKDKVSKKGSKRAKHEKKHRRKHRDSDSDSSSSDS